MKIRRRGKEKASIDKLAELFEGKEVSTKRGIFDIKYGIKISFLEIPKKLTAK